MEENYSLLAQSRANYFTQGSPVQFVQVEMLKGDVSGDIAVCLSFKNISNTLLTGLVVDFKCKNAKGEICCESQYYYEGIRAQKEDLFGSDDAVYISSSPISSVEIVLDRAFDEAGRAIPLTQYKRVRLPAARVLPANLAGALQQKTGNEALRYAPQVLDTGWYCACGAFHPNEEDCTRCSECGAERVLLQNALSSLLQKPKEPVEDKQPTRTLDGITVPVESDAVERTRMAPLSDRERFEAAYHGEGSVSEASAAGVPTAHLEGLRAIAREDKKAEEEIAHRTPEQEEADEMARAIIRWAPPITAVMCAIIAMGGYVWYQLFLG